MAGRLTINDYRNARRLPDRQAGHRSTINTQMEVLDGKAGRLTINDCRNARRLPERQAGHRTTINAKAWCYPKNP
jgi:hypothetical protein